MRNLETTASNDSLRSALGVRLALGALGVGLFVACEPPPAQPWRDQLVPDSPCYRVNLLDGLDEQDAAEVHDLFACVDHGGQFDAFVPVDQGLDATSRSGGPAALDVARVVNALPAAGVDVFGLAGVALDLLRAEDRPIDDVLDVVLELSYGLPAARVRDGDVAPGDPDALRQGALVPLGDVIPAVAEAVLEDDLRATVYASDVLAGPEAKRWVRSFGSLAGSADARVAGPIGRLLPDLGDAIVDARSATNDRWLQASGDSLADFGRSWLGRDGVLAQPAIIDSAGAIVLDPLVRARLEADIPVWYADGNLAGAPASVVWLASVNVDGDALAKGEPSALHALVKLLHDTNRPMDCSVDLWLTTLDFNLGNLAVSILNLLAGSNPDLVQSGVGLLGGLLGISESLMYDVADTGVCPAFTSEVVDNLGVIDRLYDDRSYDVLVVFLDALDAMKAGQQNRIPDLAELATALEDEHAVEPLEEVLRDAGDSAAVGDVVALVPVFATPAAYGIAAGEERAVDLHDLFGLVVWVFAEDAGRTGLQRLSPLVAPAMQASGTWDAAANLGQVMGAPGSTLGRALTIVPPLLAVDPDLTTLDDVAVLLGNEAVARPLLIVAERPEVVGPLLAAEPVEEDEVPTGFIGRLVTDGTVDEALITIDVLVGALGSQ